MKALLMFEDRDFHADAALLHAIDHPYRRERPPESAERAGQRDMINDLELEHLWNAMALGDALVYASSRTAMLSSLETVEQIRYRQAVLTDCLAQPAAVREIYGLAVQAIADERKIWRGMFSDHGEALLRRSVSVLEMLIPTLKRLRAITEEHAEEFASTYSYTVPPRDDAGSQALGRLCDRGLSLVANALGQSTDHILSFFAALRGELGFYVGCLNLHDQLAAKGEPTCLPDPHPLGTSVRSAQGLYEPCLSLRIPARAQANDLHADGKPVIIITGANQGGKSTFLRGLAVAHLMMQAGMFTAARSFAASITTGVFTHYKREEDATMTRGKFDEELARMSQIARAIDRGCLLICNESFAATNELEGSEVAYEFVRAMTRIGVTVVFVTHLYDLAHRYQREHADTTVFPRAERGADGSRPFQLAEAAPLPTSYGEDLYWRTFGRPVPALAGPDPAADGGR